MRQDDIKPKSRIKEIEEKLYQKSSKPTGDVRRGLYREDRNVPKDWASSKAPIERPRRRKGSVYKKIFIGSIIFFVFALLFALFRFILGGNAISANTISVDITARSFVDSGEELDVFVDVSNQTKTKLELVDVVLEYPEGAGGDIVRIDESIGEVPAYKKVTQKFAIIFIGQEGEDRIIKTTMFYRLPDSDAVFQKEAEHSVKISSAPTAIILEVPDRTTQNQEIEIVARVSFNSEQSITEGLLKMNYPFGFEFVSAEPEPTSGDDIWTLDLSQGNDELSRGETKVSIRGIIGGLTGQEQTFSAQFGLPKDDPQNEFATIFNSVSKVIAIDQPFLNVELVVEGSSDDINIDSNDRVQGKVFWKNSTEEDIENAQISLVFSGSAYADDTVSSQQGFFNSIDNEILWSADTSENMELIPSGRNGYFSFSLEPVDLISSGGYIKNPEIDLVVSVNGVQDGQVNSALNVDSLTLRVNSDLYILPSVTHYSGPFKNTGSMPPEAEKKTTYTIGMKIVNSSNYISNARVTTKLPSYVEWTGGISPKTEKVTYNSVTREVNWAVGDIEDGIGTPAKPAKEAYFQVEITPSKSQTGDIPDLTSQFSIFGNDTFTDNLLTDTYKPLTTKILNDSSVVGLNGRIDG